MPLPGVVPGLRASKTVWPNVTDSLQPVSRLLEMKGMCPTSVPSVGLLIQPSTLSLDGRTRQGLEDVLIGSSERPLAATPGSLLPNPHRLSLKLATTTIRDNSRAYTKINPWFTGVLKSQPPEVAGSRGTARTITWCTTPPGDFTQVLQDVAGDPTLPRTKSVRCAACGHGEAVFFQWGGRARGNARFPSPHRRRQPRRLDISSSLVQRHDNTR
uniref:Uncharacterized protein n=1 Tax=Oryza glaberrima TaxID=4538 RepID=A0A679BB13_ORYGL|nr:hypothetical protein [Oryza glaberrima]